MKYVWGFAIAVFLLAVAWWLGHWQAGVVPFAFLGFSYIASVFGASGAIIFTVLSLGGRVTIITFLGIMFTVAVLLGMVWGDSGYS